MSERLTYVIISVLLFVGTVIATWVAKQYTDPSTTHRLILVGGLFLTGFWVVTMFPERDEEP